MTQWTPWNEPASRKRRWPHAGRNMVMVVLAIAALAGALPSAGAAQDMQSLGQAMRIRASIGASTQVLKVGLDASVSLTDGLHAVGMSNRGQFPGRVSPPIPEPPRVPDGFLVGGGLRLTILERPWTSVPASSGVHRYRTGDVDEDAQFVGLGAGQAWANTWRSGGN